MLLRHPDTLTHVCSANSCSLLCIRVATARTSFVGGRQKGETEETEGGGEGRLTRKKVEKAQASTDVVLVRSTRSDARWSCLVYPNYLLSRQVRRVHQLRRARFRVTFLPFFFLPTADDALHIEMRLAMSSLSTSQRYTPYCNEVSRKTSLQHGECRVIL